MKMKMKMPKRKRNAEFRLPSLPALCSLLGFVVLQRVALIQ